VVDESGELVVAEQARVLALDAPHVERLVANGGRPLVAASWTTTGDLLQPPQPPGIFAHALLVAFEITLAFLVAYLVTGRAY